MKRQLILAMVIAGAFTVPTLSDDKVKSDRGSHEIHQTMMSGMEKMHGMKMSGDTDHDFASMMIAHHEQAIEMSKAVLDHGDDPAVRKKAREIIAASEKDISDLKKWQKQHH